jgi:LytS/YehU family sensor histidine kinase
LLPLAENAVKHGPARGHRGRVVVTTRSEGDRVRVTVENPGPYGGPRAGSHGVPTLERRLALAYGESAKLTIRGEGEKTVATVELPTRAPQVAA